MTTMKAVRIPPSAAPKAGEVQPHISAVLELEDTAEAQAQLEQHHAQGKVILQMG
ncbi:MAG TPA: zinc-binding dehydrogenase [Steroidobacteraceae bacterium]